MLNPEPIQTDQQERVELKVKLSDSLAADAFNLIKRPI